MLLCRALVLACLQCHPGAHVSGRAELGGHGERQAMYGVGAITSVTAQCW